MKFEFTAVAVALALFTFLQVCAIQQGNYAGQDFQRHQNNIRDSAHDPIAAITSKMGPGRVTPTFYHLVYGRLYNLFGEPDIWGAVAVGNLLAAVLALGLVYLLVRRLIQSPVVRVSCFIFVTFLPLTVITSLVMASEAPTLLGFFALVWLLILAVERLVQKKSHLGLMAAAAVLAILLFATKFNFATCTPALAALMLVHWRRGTLKPRPFAKAMMVMFLVPAVVCGALYAGYIKDQTLFFGRDNNGPYDVMTWRNFLWPTEFDHVLFRPIYFHEAVGAIRPFHTPNLFSYPSMLHVALFTDLLNIYQPICRTTTAPEEDEYYTRTRPPANQASMRVAVFLGIAVSLGLLFTFFYSFAFAAWRFARGGIDRNPAHTTLVVMTVCLVLGTVIFIPSTELVYVYGGWLPRHIYAGIVALGILLFCLVDRFRFTGAGVFKGLFCTFIVAQAINHVSFLKLSSEDYEVCNESTRQPKVNDTTP